MKDEYWMEIRNDSLKGLNYVNIAKKYNIDRRTAINTDYLEGRKELVFSSYKDIQFLYEYLKGYPITYL